MDENRDLIGFGPVRMNGLTRPNIMSVQSIKYNTSGNALLCSIFNPSSLLDTNFSNDCNNVTSARYASPSGRAGDEEIAV